MTTPNAMILPQTVKSGGYTARPTAANVTYSGQSLNGLALLYTSPPNGGGSTMTRLTARPIYASGSTSFPLTQAQLFKVDPAGNLIFDDDVGVPAQSLVTSASAPAPTAPGNFGYSLTNPRPLPAGWSWYVGISAAWSPGVSFSADIADY